MDSSVGPQQSRVDLLLLHRRNLGFASEADHVQWAVDAMVAGVDSPSLCLLAGLRPPFDPVEVRSYFCHAMEELGIEHPTAEESLDLYGELIARAILAGLLDPEYGMRELHRTMPEEGFYSVWYWLEEYCYWLGEARYRDWANPGFGPVAGRLPKDATLGDVVRLVALQFLEDLLRHRSG